MTRVTGFHHVALTVSDLDVSERWYAHVLDLGVAFREESDDRRAVVMTFPHGAIGVGLVEFATPHDAFDPRRTGLDHVAFSVETRTELDAWADRLSGAGVDHSGVIDVPPGAILNLRDPDGIALALFWERPT